MSSLNCDMQQLIVEFLGILRLLLAAMQYSGWAGGAWRGRCSPVVGQTAYAPALIGWGH